jgi:hypothetical protein
MLSNASVLEKRSYFKTLGRKGSGLANVRSALTSLLDLRADPAQPILKVTGLQVGAVRATIVRSVHHSGEGTLAESVRTLIASSVALKPSQEMVLATLAERGSQELVRAEYEAIAGVSRSQAAYDIAELVALGMLERVGSGRATRYRVAPQAVGRPRKWTDERIRQELAEFHSLLGRWPRAADFRESGRTDLYLAACRNGGLERWAGELDPKADRNDKGPR